MYKQVVFDKENPAYCGTTIGEMIAKKFKAVFAVVFQFLLFFSFLGFTTTMNHVFFPNIIPPLMNF